VPILWRTSAARTAKGQPWFVYAGTPLGGAIIGLVLYAVFAIFTGLMIGYVSLAVGYIVGKAMKKGSRGAGGRRYQIAAVALTYAAVSLAAVPIYISYYSKSSKPRSAQAQQSQLQPESQDQPNSAAEQTSATPPSKEHMGFGKALLQLAFIGLASPFLELTGDPLHGLIGLVILFVGIRMAWKIAAGTEVQVLGPFENSTPAPA
jgi:predicted lipid-binding transport protein (Tim44 family)